MQGQPDSFGASRASCPGLPPLPVSWFFCLVPLTQLRPCSAQIKHRKEKKPSLAWRATIRVATSCSDCTTPRWADERHTMTLELDASFFFPTVKFTTPSGFNTGSPTLVTYYVLSSSSGPLRTLMSMKNYTPSTVTRNSITAQFSPSQKLLGTAHTCDTHAELRLNDLLVNHRYLIRRDNGLDHCFTL